jgi:ADP-glucose pyrophosphorylase
MKLTKSQQNKLLNQHLGTGYMFIHSADDTYTILHIYVGKNGLWRSGNDGKLLIDRLAEMAEEINSVSEV